MMVKLHTFNCPRTRDIALLRNTIYSGHRVRQHRHKILWFNLNNDARHFEKCTHLIPRCKVIGDEKLCKLNEQSSRNACKLASLWEIHRISQRTNQYEENSAIGCANRRSPIFFAFIFLLSWNIWPFTPPADAMTESKKNSMIFRRKCDKKVIVSGRFKSLHSPPLQRAQVLKKSNATQFMCAWSKKSAGWTAGEFQLPSKPVTKQTKFMAEGEQYHGNGSFLDLSVENLVASSMNYSKYVEEHNDLAKKQKMFTPDAWSGMLRLKQYDELVEKNKEEERLCLQCTKNRRLLELVWQTVSNEYFDPHGNFSQSNWSAQLPLSFQKSGGLLRTKAQTYTALKEMVASLGDKYSVFLEPSQYRRAIYKPVPSEVRYLTLQYTGIGMELGSVSPYGGLTIVAPFAGSPAEEAGINGGDRLVSVDGTPVNDLTADEAVALLRGPIGSMVEIEVTGPNEDSITQTLFLERRALPLPPVKIRFVDGPGGSQFEYIRLHYFTHRGTNDMAAAIKVGEALGVDGYVIDLRNNPGGVFEEAIAMAALWLNCDGCDLAETVRTNRSPGAADIEDFVYQQGKLPREIFGNHPGALTQAPLVVITNHSSASASEVLTGALKDNGRAAVIGQETFGKGVVQYYFPMDDGSGLKLTVAKYLTPSRYDISIQGGIKPDRTCSDHPRKETVDDCIKEAVKYLVSDINAGDYQASLSKERYSSSIIPYRWMLKDGRPWQIIRWQ